jgi:hypothetical protein
LLLLGLGLDSLPVFFSTLGKNSLVIAPFSVKPLYYEIATRVRPFVLRAKQLKI